MKVNRIEATIGAPRAKKLGLQSSRFHDRHMSTRAQEAIEHVKRRDRSNIEVLFLTCS